MSNWTLFLDRDGVINEEPPVEQIYVNKLSQFHLYPDTLKALQLANSLFQHIVIATNQRGVFRGLTPIEELQRIHTYLLVEVQKTGGRIDKIYYSADGESDHPNRKPNSGMAFQAQKDFPEIDFSRSIMIGNNPSDMQFGRNVGMKTIFLTTTKPIEKVQAGLYDYHFPSLYKAALFLQDNLDNL
jgi:D-glycero-D-manno-heptose 1,7-bisphosphate phosphatase